jgi:RND superfamily putative drug exporter
VIGLCALLLFPEPISHSFGLGGVSVVLFNIVAALTVMPALLGVLGHRVNALRVPWPRRRRSAAEAAANGGWARFARAVMRRPVAWLVAGVVILLAAAGPLVTLHPGLTNHRYLPVSNEGQVVARMVNNDFPAGGPGQVTIDIAVVGDVNTPALNDYVHRLAGVRGVAGAGIHLRDTNVAWVALNYLGEADEAANLQLVRDVREQPHPAGASEVLVGGQGGPALSLDANNDTLGSLPVALIFVGLATLILLFLAFGSVVIPVQALVIAFLSLTASLGVVTWAFQNGGLAGLMGFHVVGTTDLWTLGLIITIAFGLVTDYEMFLVSRTREEYLATGDNEHSVAVGLQHTGSIITRAAVLMIVVLATMGFSATSLFLETLGVGLTLSVVIDAVLVRTIVVPATMRLFGRVNWWAPAALRRVSDRVGLSEGLPPATPESARQPGDQVAQVP